MVSERERYSNWVPFPQIPDSIRAKYSPGNLSLRAFGIFEKDLEIDFNQKRPYVVTQILQACTRDGDGDTFEPSFFWELTIGKRIECLLAIATSGGSSELSIHLRCLNEACQQSMEIDMSLEELADLQHRTDDTDYVVIRIGDENLRLRKPTGTDQLEWMKHSFADESSAVKAMIQSLVFDYGESNQEHHLSDEWIKGINEAMEELDPLVNFSLTVYCPHCNQEGHHELNLEELSLQELHKAQLNLLQVIHRLGGHYHWSEQQILSIPPWRRSHYLALIEKEEAR